DVDLRLRREDFVRRAARAQRGDEEVREPRHEEAEHGHDDHELDEGEARFVANDTHRLLLVGSGGSQLNPRTREGAVSRALTRVRSAQSYEPSVAPTAEQEAVVVVPTVFVATLPVIEAKPVLVVWLPPM